MIKRRYLYLLLAILVAAAILLVSKSDSIQEVLRTKKSFPALPPPSTPLRLPESQAVGEKIKKQETVESEDSESGQTDMSIESEDEVTKAWKSKVEKSLFLQGGRELKAVNIQRVDSFIWDYEGISLNVESVVISITNQKGEERKFRAMIDPLNGKILRTWDYPVVDSMNPRENQTGLKLDPRYHGK